MRQRGCRPRRRRSGDHLVGGGDQRRAPAQNAGLDSVRRDIALLSIASLFSFALWIALMAWAAGGARNDGVIGRFMGDRRTRRLVHLGVAGFAAFSFGGTLGGLNII